MLLFAANPVIQTTNETCPGNGTILCNLNGATGTNIKFRVYLLPDTTTIIAELQQGETLNVASGQYQIIASEVISGATVNYPPEQVTIQNQLIPLTYSLASTDAFCNDGTISVTTNTGTAPFTYALTEGPLTFPAQASPHFSGLPGGTYKVLVVDACGIQLTQTRIIPVNPVDLTIGPATLPESQLPACDRIITQNNIGITQINDIILYPLHLTYTVFPPGGGSPVILTSTITTGGAASLQAQMEIPFYYDQNYTYNLEIVDGCGTVFTRNNNVVDQQLDLLIDILPADCGTYFLGIKPRNYFPGFNIEFVSAPSGFNPSDFNAGHPGPFTLDNISYGDSATSVPFGTYVVRVTDSCGRTAEKSVTLEDIPIEPMGQLTPHPGCTSNISDLEAIWPGQIITSVMLVDAPAGYPFPQDVSSGIENPAHFYWTNMPAGHYTFMLTNECGQTEPLEVNVLDLDANLTLSVNTRGDCQPGKGAIRIRGNQSTVVGATMLSGPSEFSLTYPLNMDHNVSPSGVFSMGALPPGLYSFEILDSCGVLHLVEDVNVKPYTPISTNASFTPHCNSFELYLNEISENGVEESYWLQEFDDVTETWGHPGTGAPYTEGDAPNLITAVLLLNGQNNINQPYLGKFRVIKAWRTFRDGSLGDPTVVTCTNVIYEFEFYGLVEITDVIKLTCDGSLSSVKVIAEGVAPFHYRITEKNYLPFLIDNGSNDTFTDLEPAIYTFTVSHYCGDTDPQIVDIASLPSQVEAYNPIPVLTECESQSNDGTAQFDLSVQTPMILGAQDPDNYTVTYHISQADADSGQNPLPELFTSTDAEIFGRIAINSGDCYGTTSFQIKVNPIPESEIAQQTPLCPGSTIAISADAAYDHYLWSTGDTGNTILVSQPGTYSVTVTKDYPEGSCSAVFSTEVFEVTQATISEIITVDWTDNQNSITVSTDNPGNQELEYSLDGVLYQSSPVFNNLLAGVYTVYMRDVYRCGSDDQTVQLLTYPKFFTPNGDGYNDYWKVKFSESEPGMETYIFDRYGKFLKQLGSASQGWDGTYNGKMLPSTDYWFLVKRADGREFRGHFAMKR